MKPGRPARVLFVVPDLGVGGAERHVTTLLPELDPRRFQAGVLCIGRQGGLFSELADRGIPARALNRTKRQAIRALADLVRHMRKVRPDIVVVRGYNAEMLGRLAAILVRVPHIVTWVHNCDDTSPRSGVRRVADRVFDPFTSSYFGVATAQVPYLSDELRYSPRKIQIIHNGVDPADFDPTDDRSPLAEFGIDRDSPVVGIVAAMRAEKDHAGLLRAAQAVLRSLPAARFLLIGDGPCRQDLESLAKELDIADNVVFTGSRSDVGALLRAIDVFVLNSYTVECFPMALLEAMAAGRPAVCTDVGGVPEMIVDGVTGFLVPPRDPQTLADRILTILRAPERSRAMGKAARERVESNFSLRRSVDRAEAALGNLARAPARRRDEPVRLSLVLDVMTVGGIETLMLNLFQQWDPQVVEPRLICLRDTGPLARDVEAAGFDVEVLGRSSRYDVRTLPRLVRSLRANRTDVVLVAHHHQASLALGRLAARIARVPANVIAVHGMGMTAVGKRCLPRWAVNSLFLSNALVLLSPRQGEYLHKEEGVGRRPWSRIPEVVIPNGIVLPPPATAAQRSAARTDLGLGRDDFVVGIVARLSAEKAHHVLFDAVSRLSLTVPSMRLVVIGGGERESELKALAADLGIGDSTIFTGIRRDVPRLLPGLDVACLSSVHEGVPITVIEAMAAGLPVVATDCGSLPDLIDDGEHGYLVPVGDAAAMADRLMTLARDPVLRTRLGAHGRARAERDFRIEATARGFERLVTELLDKRK